MAGLTDSKIAGLKAPAKGQAEYADGDVPGLRVRVGASGTKTFILRKRVAGKPVNITLGRYQPPRFGLKAARAKARTLISDIENGANPVARVIEERKASASAGTVRALWEDYKRTEVETKRSKVEIVRVFDTYVLPKLGDRMADAVTRGDVTRFIDEIAQGGARPTPIMARNVFAQLSAFYGWAMPRLDRLPSNPCRDARKPPKADARDRTLDDVELRALWQSADLEPHPWRSAIKLAILTGARRDEVFNADRAEFDREGKLWTIAAARTKNGAAHLIPLSEQVLAVLATVPEFANAPKLFPSRSDPEKGPSGFSKVMKRITANVEALVGRPVAPWVLHDVRRTVATGMQRLGVRLEVTEACLNHISGARSGIVGLYQRYDYLAEKGEALAAWGTDVDRIVSGTQRTMGQIVPLKRGK
ncbi:hypothetical protein ASD76_09645 [Altererythrobacter sp. Root672]|nr:hypothetical protein ASD76_09645 [Altererythrobacter sp. Root672]